MPRSIKVDVGCQAGRMHGAGRDTAPQRAGCTRLGSSRARHAASWKAWRTAAVLVLVSLEGLSIGRAAVVAAAAQSWRDGSVRGQGTCWAGRVNKRAQLLLRMWCASRQGCCGQGCARGCVRGPGTWSCAPQTLQLTGRNAWQGAPVQPVEGVPLAARQLLWECIHEGGCHCIRCRLLLGGQAVQVVQPALEWGGHEDGQVVQLKHSWGAGERQGGGSRRGGERGDGGGAHSVLGCRELGGRHTLVRPHKQVMACCS